MIRVLSNSRLMSRRTTRDGSRFSLFQSRTVFLCSATLAFSAYHALSFPSCVWKSHLKNFTLLDARLASKTDECNVAFVFFSPFPVSFVIVVYKDTSKQDSMDLWFFSSSSLGLLLATVSPQDISPGLSPLYGALGPYFPTKALLHFPPHPIAY